MNEKRTFSKALRQSAPSRTLSPVKRAILNEKEPADDLLLNAEQDVFDGLNAHTLLACAFSKDLPPAYQLRYATIILDRAPWAALEDTETSEKRSLTYIPRKTHISLIGPSRLMTKHSPFV